MENVIVALILAIFIAYLFSSYKKDILWKKIFWSQDQCIVITGGSEGIGKCLALKLAVHPQATIVILDVVEPSFIDEYKNIYFYYCDVSRLEVVLDVSQKVIERHSVPSILINNAAICLDGQKLVDKPFENIRRTIDTNLFGTIWTVKAFLPHMMNKNCGHIVNMSSSLGLVGAAHVADYSASKFGLYGFHESLRQELLETNIRTTVLCPTKVNTSLFRGVKVRFPLVIPELEQEEVADKIIDCLESKGYPHKDVWLPLASYGSLVCRAGPVWLNDFLHTFLGANTAMANFVPKKYPIFADPELNKGE